VNLFVEPKIKEFVKHGSLSQRDVLITDGCSNGGANVLQSCRSATANDLSISWVCSSDAVSCAW